MFCFSYRCVVGANFVFVQIPLFASSIGLVRRNRADTRFAPT